MRLAREVVDSGQLGDLVCVNGSALFYKPDEYYEQAPWRKEKGSGPILLNMTHEIQNLRLLCGEITNVEARTSNATRGFEIEDTAALVLTFASGVLGTFLVSDTVASPRSWEQTSQENPQYTTYETEDCYHLAGTMGSLSLPTMKIHSYARPEDRSWWKPFEESTARAAPAVPCRTRGRPLRRRRPRRGHARLHDPRRADEHAGRRGHPRVSRHRAGRRRPP